MLHVLSMNLHHLAPACLLLLVTSCAAPDGDEAGESASAATSASSASAHKRATVDFISFVEASWQANKFSVETARSLKTPLAEKCQAVAALAPANKFETSDGTMVMLMCDAFERQLQDFVGTPSPRATEVERSMAELRNLNAALRMSAQAEGFLFGTAISR